MKKVDNNKTYCYVIIEPLFNKFYMGNSCLLGEWNNLCAIESPFGKKVYINEYGKLQIKSSYLILINSDEFTSKKNRVVYLYNGKFVVGGIVREWSKYPIKPKINKIERYKDLQKQIDELRLKQTMLLNEK